MKLTNQCKRLLKHLESNGSITPLEALAELSIYRLADTVFKLRNLGYDIKTVQTKSYNKYKERVQFATYVYTKKDNK